MWKVTIVKEPTPGIFRENYFPRLFFSKRAALVLAVAVKLHGGEAEVVKVVKEKH